MAAQTSLEAARAAKTKARTIFARLPYVNGVGLTRRDGSYAVKVNLEMAPDEQDLPKDIDGVPVVFNVIGRIHKQ
jgi:hypothetical protein